MQQTKLIVLRGPSGSGKSSAALAVREAFLGKMALVQQDYLRRTLLKEKDVADGLNIQLIEDVTLFALNHSHSVIMEGIFDKGRYTKMFENILKVHPDNNYFFYFDVSLEETLKRHELKPNKDQFGEKELRSWYKPGDFLDIVKEDIIPESYTFQQTVEYILTQSALVPKMS